MAEKAARGPYWRVTYLLKGKPLADLQVEAASEAQAIAVARTQVRANIRRLADETTVKRVH